MSSCETETVAKFLMSSFSSGHKAMSINDLFRPHDSVRLVVTDECTE
jgi:hypothetical protein